MPLRKTSNSKPPLKPSAPFQRDGQGRYVFFPQGRWGNGYVVRDPEKRKIISGLYSASAWGAIITVILMRLTRYSHHALASWGFGFLLLLWAIYYFVARAMVKGLPVSKTKYKSNYGHPQAFSRSGHWVFFGVFIGAGLLFLALAVWSWGMRPATGDLLLALLFFAVAAWFFWRLWLRRNEKPPAKTPPFIPPFRTLWAATAKDGKPKPVYWTWGLIGFLGLVFTLENLFAFDSTPKVLLAPGLGSLVAFGGASHDLIFERGDWWRFFTPVLLHASLLHIFFNCMALWLAGLVLERLVGPAWFLALFFFCGFGGSLFSVMLNPPSLVGVGASGAIMGLIAAGFVISFRLPEGPARRGLQYNLLQMLVLNTLPFFIARGTGSTDYGAHLGGALFGGAAGFFLFREWDLKKFQARWGGLGKGLAYGGGAVYLTAVVFAVAGFTGSRQWYADNQLTEKIQLYTTFIQRDPKNDKAFYGRGYCYYREKTTDGYQKAIEDFTSALSISSDNFDALFLRGCAHRHLGELPQSIDDMNRCALLKPDNIYVYNNRGLAYAEWKKYKQALDDYAEALRINPQAPYVLVNEGDVYFQLHRYTKAMADLNQAIDLSQIFGKAFADRGSIYLLQGNLKMALSDFDMALKLNSRDVAAYQGRAVVYEKMDLPQMAEDDVKNAKLYQNTGLND